MLNLNDLNIYIIPVTPYQQNCSIVQCKKTFKTAIIDPGGEIDRILNFIKNQGNMQIQHILLTHGHLDHCGQANKLAKILDLPIKGPEQEDRFWMDQLHAQSISYGKRFNFEEADNFLPNIWFNDGDSLFLGEHKIDIIHTPGHTPGHVVYYIKEQKIAWVGDVIFKDAVGRSDFPRGNTQQLMDSIINKLLPLGDDITFICGHGETSTFGREKKYNPFIQPYL